MKKVKIIKSILFNTQRITRRRVVKLLKIQLQNNRSILNLGILKKNLKFLENLRRETPKGLNAESRIWQGIRSWVS